MEEDIRENEAGMPWHTGRTAARFLAAQGAYAMMFGSYDSGDLEELIEYLSEMRGVMDLTKTDKRLLTKILLCMLERQIEVNALISLHISEKWAMNRINLFSLAIIQAGVCELLCLNTHECIVINEYADIASSVLDDGEISFVNAILNKAKTVRSMDAEQLLTCRNSNAAVGDSIALQKRIIDADSGAIHDSVTASTTSGTITSDVFTVGC